MSVPEKSEKKGGMDKMEFLQKYHKDIQIVSEGFGGMDEIPESWRMCLQKKSRQEKVEAILEMWTEIAGDFLKQTILYLTQYLVDVELITYKYYYSLLYSIATPEGELLYYEGGNPEDFLMLNELKRRWNAVPESFHSFYERLHDGFYCYSRNSLGMYSLNNVLYLDAYTWPFIEEAEKEPKLLLDMESTFGFFGAETGANIVIDLENCEDDKAALWFSDREPVYDIHFWKIVDAAFVQNFRK